MARRKFIKSLSKRVMRPFRNLKADDMRLYREVMSPTVTQRGVKLKHRPRVSKDVQAFSRKNTRAVGTALDRRRKKRVAGVAGGIAAVGGLSGFTLRRRKKNEKRSSTRGKIRRSSDRRRRDRKGRFR